MTYFLDDPSPHQPSPERFENFRAALWRLGREDETASHFKRAAALGSAGRPDPKLMVPRPGAPGPDGS